MGILDTRIYARLGDILSALGGAPGGGTARTKIAWVDKSGTATITSATLMAANADRLGWQIENIGTVNLRINFGAAATTGPGSLLIGPKGSYADPAGLVSTQEITVICDSGTCAYTAKEC